MSFLLLISFSSISSGIPSAYANTLAGNSSGRPCFLIIVKISNPFSPFFPNTSLITPSGLLLLSGHLVTSAITISP